MSDEEYLTDDEIRERYPNPDLPPWTVADTARLLAMDLGEVEAEADQIHLRLQQVQAERDQLLEDLKAETEARRSFMVAATEFGHVIENLKDERGRLQAVVDEYESAARDGALNAIGVDEPLTGVVAERNRLRAVVAEYQRTYHVIDHAFDDDDVDGVGPQYRDWKKAQTALLETPTGDGQGGDVSGPSWEDVAMARQEPINQLRAERDKLQAELAFLHQLIRESVAKVLDVADPDDTTPAVQRLRAAMGDQT